MSKIETLKRKKGFNILPPFLLQHQDTVKDKMSCMIRGWFYLADFTGNIIISDGGLKEKEGSCDCIDADKESSLNHTRVMRNDGQQSIMKKGGSFEVSSFWNRCSKRHH